MLSAFSAKTLCLLAVKNTIDRRSITVVLCAFSVPLWLNSPSYVGRAGVKPFGIPHCTPKDYYLYHSCS